jgi:hypothetical protein
VMLGPAKSKKHCQRNHQKRKHVQGKQRLSPPFPNMLGRGPPTLGKCQEVASGLGLKMSNGCRAVFSDRVDASLTFIGRQSIPGCDLRHGKQCSELLSTQVRKYDDV